MSVRCPWTGEQVVFSERDDINDPDEVLYWRGVGLGKIKADPKKLEETFGIVPTKKKGKNRGRK